MKILSKFTFQRSWLSSVLVIFSQVYHVDNCSALDLLIVCWYNYEYYINATSWVLLAFTSNWHQPSRPGASLRICSQLVLQAWPFSLIKIIKLFNDKCSNPNPDLSPCLLSSLSSLMTILCHFVMILAMSGGDSGPRSGPRTSEWMTSVLITVRSELRLPSTMPGLHQDTPAREISWRLIGQKPPVQASYWPTLVIQAPGFTLTRSLNSELGSDFRPKYKFSLPTYHAESKLQVSVLVWNKILRCNGRRWR